MTLTLTKIVAYIGLITVLICCNDPNTQSSVNQNKDSTAAIAAKTLVDSRIISWDFSRVYNSQTPNPWTQRVTFSENICSASLNYENLYVTKSNCNPTTNFHEYTIDYSSPGRFYRYLCGENGETEGVHKVFVDGAESYAYSILKPGKTPPPLSFLGKVDTFLSESAKRAPSKGAKTKVNLLPDTSLCDDEQQSLAIECSDKITKMSFSKSGNNLTFVIQVYGYIIDDLIDVNTGENDQNVINIYLTEGIADTPSTKTFVLTGYGAAPYINSSFLIIPTVKNGCGLIDFGCPYKIAAFHF